MYLKTLFVRNEPPVHCKSVSTAHPHKGGCVRFTLAVSTRIRRANGEYTIEGGSRQPKKLRKEKKMSRYGDLIRRNKTQGVAPSKEVLEQKEQAKIFTGIIHCKGIDIHMEYTWDEFDQRYNTPLSVPVPEERQPLPPSPYSTFKDEHKNDFLNAYYLEFQRAGIIDALQHEEQFRTALIRMTRHLDVYPFNFTDKTKGYLYDPSFLDLFPSKVGIPWKKALQRGFKLITIKKLPYMMAKENFTVIQTINSQAELIL